MQAAAGEHRPSEEDESLRRAPGVTAAAPPLPLLPGWTTLLEHHGLHSHVVTLLSPLRNKKTARCFPPSVPQTTNEATKTWREPIIQQEICRTHNKLTQPTHALQQPTVSDKICAHSLLTHTHTHEHTPHCCLRPLLSAHNAGTCLPPLQRDGGGAAVRFQSIKGGCAQDVTTHREKETHTRHTPRQTCLNTVSPLHHTTRTHTCLLHTRLVVPNGQ